MFRLLATDNFTGDIFEGFPGPTATMDTHSFLLDTQSGRKILRFTNIPTRVYPKGHFPERFGPICWVATDVQLEKEEGQVMTIQQWCKPDMIYRANRVVKTITMDVNLNQEYQLSSYLSNGTPILTERPIQTWTKFKTGKISFPAQFFADGELTKEMFPAGIREIFPSAETRSAIHDFISKQDQLFAIHKQLAFMSKETVTAGQAIGALPAATPGYSLAAIAAAAAASENPPGAQTESPAAVSAPPPSPTMEEAPGQRPEASTESRSAAATAVPAETAGPSNIQQQQQAGEPEKQFKVRKDTPHPRAGHDPQPVRTFGFAITRDKRTDWPFLIDDGRIPEDFAVTFENNGPSMDMSIIAEDPAIASCKRSADTERAPPASPTPSTSGAETPKRARQQYSMEIQSFANRFAQASPTSRPGKAPATLTTPTRKKNSPARKNSPKKKVSFKITPNNKSGPQVIHAVFENSESSTTETSSENLNPVPARVTSRPIPRIRRESTDSEDPDKTA